MGQALTSMGLCSDCLCCCSVEAYEDVDSYQKTGPNDKTPRWNPNEEDAVSHGKSGGSLRSQSGTLKEGPVGLGKSGGSQGSGQNGSQTNENNDEKPIHESPSLSENPGAGSQGSVGHGKSGGSQGSGQNGSQTNENNDEKSIHEKEKIKTNEDKIVLAVDPKSTEEERANDPLAPPGGYHCQIVKGLLERTADRSQILMNLSTETWKE